MFAKSGIIELHAVMHDRLDLLLSHVATVPDDLAARKFQDSARHPFGSSLSTS